MRTDGSIAFQEIDCASARAVPPLALYEKHNEWASKTMLLAVTMDGVVMDAKKLEAKLQRLATRSITRESLTVVMDRLFPQPEGKDRNTTRRENILTDVLTLYESNDNNPCLRFVAQPTEYGPPHGTADRCAATQRDSVTANP